MRLLQRVLHCHTGPAMLTIFRPFLLALSLTLTAQLYGDLREGDAPVSGAKMQLTCGAETASATTDSAGAFVLFVKQPGKCVVKVEYKGQSPSLAVTLYEEPVRYRLVLEKSGSTYRLARR